MLKLIWFHFFVFCDCQNNFLQAFPSVPMPKAGGVKATSVGGGGSLLGLWLRLLVSLSFTEDIQQSILRVTGALELLADLAPHRRHALLTLHNLCFCPGNKPHIIANGMKWKQRFTLTISHRNMKAFKQKSTKGTAACFWYVSVWSSDKNHHFKHEPLCGYAHWSQRKS